MTIKIYFTDLKPKKQRELLPKLREFFDGEIPTPLVEFGVLPSLIRGTGAKSTLPIGKQIEDIVLDPHERREQDAQIASENQEDEPEREDGEYEF